MVAHGIGLGFWWRESSEGYEGLEYESEAELLEQQCAGVPQLGNSSSNSSNKDGSRITAKKEDKQKGGDDAATLLVDFGEPPRSLMSGARRRNGGEDVNFSSLDEHHSGMSDHAVSTVFGYQRKDHAKQEGGEASSHQQHDVVSNIISNTSCSFRQEYDFEKLVGGEADTGFPRQQQNGLNMDTNVGFQRKREGGKRKGEMLTESLPGELVEKIISMMPFPEIMNARTLCRAWYSKFSTDSDAAVFQNYVKSVSSKWKHYCPIILNVEEEWLMGFDRECNRWQKMLMEFEADDLRNWFSTEKLRGAGCLMCGVRQSQIFVTNIVTRTWIWLPSRPDMECPKGIHLLPIGCDAYQVLLISKLKNRAEVCCELYDSRTKLWTVKLSMANTALFNSSTTYLNGVLYVMEYDPDDRSDIMKLLAYNVEDGTWTNIPHPFRNMLHEIETYELLVCQFHVMVVIQVHPTATSWDTNRDTLRNSLMVYRLDPVSLNLREVARGPPQNISGASSALFASDHNSIYFGNPQVKNSSVLVLNLKKRDWSCVPPPPCTDGSFKNKWATFAFQPGLNPFVVV